MSTSSRPVVVLGTSRSNGETYRAVKLAFGDEADIIDLQDHDISPYDYEYRNKNDDFLKIVDALLGRETIVFATPVYWYAMSSQLKTFFDRLSDLVRVEKPRGRAMADKAVWLVASGTDPEPPEGFEVPFRKTCEYLNMNYKGASYLYTHTDPDLRKSTEGAVAQFGASILKECGITPSEKPCATDVR